ncbi:hypothetical protein STANM309S_05828 [Streptomyces tanashiensis]
MNAEMSHASFLPPCRASRARGGGHPLVGGSGRRGRTRSAAHPPGRCFAVSRLWATCTADVADATRPDRTRHARPASDATPGSGRPPSPAARTARTTDVRKGSGAGCSATVARTRSSPVSPVVRSPHAREWHSDHHGQSARGPRAPEHGGRFFGALGTPPASRHGSNRSRRFCAGSGVRTPACLRYAAPTPALLLAHRHGQARAPNLSKFLPPGAVASEDDKTRRSTVQSVKLAGPGLDRNGS